MATSNPLLEAALFVENHCRRMKWQFCFIGGLAVARWGEVRATNDADLCIMTGFGGEATIVDELLRVMRPRRVDAREFAMRHRVLLLTTEDGVACDVALGAINFEKQMVRRAQPQSYAPDVELTVCSPEDLLVAKAFAGRPRDWLDVEGIIIKNGTSLDWRHIRKWLRELCLPLEMPEPIKQVEKLRKKHAG